MESPWKNHFPALSNSKICYLDSAATTQVPKVVIESISDYLSDGCGNPGRGAYSQSENATLIINKCRKTVASFINCSAAQIVFTKGATESINMVANSLGLKLSANDSILVTQMEHHANLLPWLRICRETGARLNVLPLTAKGELDCSNLEAFLSDNCRIFALTHCSNVLGFINPINELCKIAKKHGVETLVDGAQSVSHQRIDLQQTNCDYYVFSGHKVYASGGSGVLYAKKPEQLSPLLLGGGIVTKVTNQDYQLQNGISKLEAGSSNMVAISALATAVEYIQDIGLQKIEEYEHQLTQKLYAAVDQLNNYQLISHKDSSNIISFNHKTFHCHDIASVLAEQDVSVRAGHHCAQPCLRALGVKHCLRASIGLYNGEDDINRLIEGLKQAQKILC